MTRPPAALSRYGHFPGNHDAPGTHDHAGLVPEPVVDLVKEVGETGGARS